MNLKKANALANLARLLYRLETIELKTLDIWIDEIQFMIYMSEMFRDPSESAQGFYTLDQLRLERGLSDE